MKEFARLLISLFLILIGMSSCVKDLKELRNMDSLDYTPSFSLPIGPLSYTLDDIMPPDSLSEYAIPDTALVSDSSALSILIYNDILYFENPEEGYSATFFQAVSFSNLSQQPENVESAMLKTNIANNLPIAIDLQVYFLNDQGEVLDSVCEQGPIRIERPEIASDGTITEPRRETVYTHYNRDEVANLLNAATMEIYIFLQTRTEGVDTLRVYSWNGIDLQLALRADLIIPIQP